MTQPVYFPAVAAPLVSIVAPTLNERDNVRPLFAAIAAAMGETPWEIIFVDDNSKDGTAEEAKALSLEDARVRCIRRVGRRGLSTAAIEGFLASAAPYIALIDADMQHDEAALPAMLAKLQADEADIVVGSRYVDGGSADGLADAGRAWLSKAGGWLAHKVLRVTVSDPMSGFFAMKRSVFDGIAPALSGQGFKILTDILASAETPLRHGEVAYTFRPRNAGESKLDAGVKIDYLMLLADKLLARFMPFIPLRFVLFGLVGGFGVGVHLAALWLYRFGFGLEFMWAQGLAAATAMTTNFLINNAFTYRDRQLKGLKLVWGLLSFYAVCGIGLAASVGVADWLYGSDDERWWVAGLLGALVGSVWNYAASSAVTWKATRG